MLRENGPIETVLKRIAETPDALEVAKEGLNRCIELAQLRNANNPLKLLESIENEAKQTLNIIEKADFFYEPGKIEETDFDKMF